MTEHLISWHSLEAEAGANGVIRRRLKGNGAELVRVEIPAGVVAPGHSHPHEQFVEVLRGSGTLTTPDGTRPFKAGDVFHFPAETEHAASFDADTVFLEINLP
ncbi:MAG: cupin domain-containing protein [Gammaproteobacteria bacterium]|nr:cupin domain-containing protein [Gammaproteobacteria bacterium]